MTAYDRGHAAADRQVVNVGTDPIRCQECGMTCRIAWEVKA
jgi:hypothetical protein